LFDSTKYCLFASFVSIIMDLQIWHRFFLYFFLIVLLNMIMFFLEFLNFSMLFSYNILLWFSFLQSSNKHIENLMAFK
jgi:hypothetical protein